MLNIKKYDVILLILPILSIMGLYIDLVLLPLYILGLSYSINIIDTEIVQKQYISIYKFIITGIFLTFPVVFYVFPEGLSNLWGFSLIKSSAISIALTFFLSLHYGLYILIRQFCIKQGIKNEALFAGVFVSIDAIQTRSLAPIDLGNLLLYTIDSPKIWNLLSFSGISVLTFIMYFFILSSYKIIFKKNYKYLFYSLILIGALFLNNSKNEPENNKNNLKIAVIQPNFSTNKILNKKELLVQELVDLYKKEVPSDIDVLVLPESIYPYIYNENKSYKENYYRELFSQMKNKNLLVFGGFIKDKNNKITNNTILEYKNESKNISKNFLLPFGEYVPGIKTFPFLKDIFDEYIPYSTHEMNNSNDFYPVNYNINNKKIYFNAAICYEILFSDLVRKKMTLTNVFFNLAQGSWFDDQVFKKNGPSRWSYIHLRARAIEYGIPFIRAANTSGSYIINGDGEVLKSIPQKKRGVIVANVSLNKKRTSYSENGDFFRNLITYLTIILFSLLNIFNIRKRMRDSSQQ